MASDGKEIQAIGEMSRAAKADLDLINKVTGMVFGPRAIRNLADAEAYRIRTLAEASADATNIEARARVSSEHRQVAQQLNMEVVTEAALPHIKDDAKPETVDQDWVAKFFDYAKDVSNGEMREMWARILAGEINRPGSFSRRSLNIVSQIDKRQAELFNTVCRFRVRGENDSGWVVISDFRDPIYKDAGITFEGLADLDDLGLIDFAPADTFNWEGLPQTTGLYYGRTFFSMSFMAGTDSNLKLGRVRLTRVGEELTKICETKEVDGFVGYLKRYWETQGVGVTIIADPGKIVV